MNAAIPADPVSTAALEAKGLRYGLVDTADRDAFARWVDADLRGFHHPRAAAATLGAQLDALAGNRTTGVWDDALADPATPVATVSSWDSELTVSPGRTLPVHAISSVTVSPTHRRRGIARAMLEGELRTAVAAGLPAAVLTVTEATIYGRYGFAPAAAAATATVDRRHARWAGPIDDLRVRFVEPAAFRDEIADLTEAAVLRRAGEVVRPGFDHDDLLGLLDPDAERSRALRIVRVDGPDGSPHGFAVYRVERTPPDRGVVHVSRFVALDDAGGRALWRFLVEQDYVDRVVVPLRPIDDPLPWLLEDPRAVSFESHVDHLWLRVLDPVAALQSREYAAPGELVFEIADDLGFAAGTVRLQVDGTGAGRVERVAVPAPDAARLILDVQALGSLLLGGVRASVLAAAGRIRPAGDDPSALLALADRVFLPERTPLLSYWF